MHWLKRWPSLFLALFVVAVLAGACSDRAYTPDGAIHAVAVRPAPSLAIAPAFATDQGATLEATAYVADRRGDEIEVTIDYGDGTIERTWAGVSGRVQLAHTYRRGGDYEVTVTARALGGEAAAASTVTVAPRHIVYVQGMNSESECPGGQHFLDRAPGWLAPYYAEDPALAAVMDLDESNFVYFSYSGRYCDGSDGTTGAAPDYGKGDTCEGIEHNAGPRLRALIDGLPPGRVTVVAHSMGGLLTAWAIGDDPEWARERIASVVTFDSPLGGVDRMRREVLGFLSWGSDLCGRGSQSIDDVSNGSSVLAVAREAAFVVPFYTVDGTADETEAFGIAEAVTGGNTIIEGSRAHWQVDEEHNAIWSRTPTELDDRDKRRFVVCAILNDPVCAPK